MSNMTDVQSELTIPTWTFGDRIRKAREHAGLTQAELADELGNIHRKTLARWETDQVEPRHVFDLVDDLERITGVDRWWMLGAYNNPGVDLRNRCFSCGQVSCHGCGPDVMHGYMKAS